MSENDIKILMKKFTISFLTVLVFTVVSMLGCIGVSAEEQLMTADFSMKEYMELENTPPVLSEISIASDNGTDYSFYDQLDDNNKSAYDAMVDNWLEPNTDQLSYTLAEKVTYQAESTDLNSWTDEQKSEFWGMVFATFKCGEVAFMYDHPEIFWYTREEIAVSISFSTSYSYRKQLYTITVSKVLLTPSIKAGLADEEYALEQQNFLLDKIAEVEIEGDDYYTKLKSIHDFIAKNVTYNLEAPFTDTSYGMFVEPYQFICEGYSETFKLLCDREGIPCISVIGNVNPDTNMAHMWNYVIMEDGNWYAVDVTWDDLDNESNPVKYQYFLKGSTSFLPSHTPDDTYVTPGFVYPELSESDYVYASGEPVVTTSTTETTTTTTTTTIKSETTTTTTTTEKSQTTDSSTTTVTTTAETTTSSTTSTTIKTIPVFSSTSETETTVLTTVTSVTETTVTTQLTSEPVVTVLKGDFNRNGYIDIGDATAIQKMLVKVREITAEDIKYDLNNDEKLNIWDYVILVRILIS